MISFKTRRVNWRPGTSESEKAQLLPKFKENKNDTPYFNDEEIGEWFTYNHSCSKGCGCSWLEWHEGFPSLHNTWYEPQSLDPKAGYACPVCEPDPAEMNVEEWDADQRRLMARKLIQTDTREELAVLLDQALNEGQTEMSKWHNPDDLQKIKDLELSLKLAMGIIP